MLLHHFRSFSGSLRGFGSLVIPLRTVRFLGIRIFFLLFLQLQTAITQLVLIVSSWFWSQSMRNWTWMSKMLLLWIRLWSIKKLWRHLCNMVFWALNRVIVLKGLDKKWPNLNFVIFSVSDRKSCYYIILGHFLALWEVSDLWLTLWGP